MKKIAFCLGLFFVFMFNSCSTENENINVSEINIPEVASKINNDDITKESLVLFENLRKNYEEEIKINKFLSGNEELLINEIKKVKTQSELNLVFDRFNVSSSFKLSFNEINKQLVRNFNLIDNKYLKSFTLKEKTEIFSYLDKNNPIESKSLKPTNCCGEYNHALNKCVRNAFYDWYVLWSGGISAIWYSVQAVQRSNDCIHDAEDRYERCCR